MKPVVVPEGSAFKTTNAAHVSMFVERVHSSSNNVPGDCSPPNSAARAAAALAPPIGRPVDGFPKEAKEEGIDSVARSKKDRAEVSGTTNELRMCLLATGRTVI